MMVSIFFARAGGFLPPARSMAEDRDRWAEKEKQTRRPEGRGLAGTLTRSAPCLRETDSVCPIA